MTEQEAISTISTGNIVRCTASEYPALRTAIQAQAGKWIDQGDALRAMIALQEVKRLDAKFDYHPGEER